MAEIKCPKCGSTNAHNFQDKENWYRCRGCLEFLYANEHGVVDCEMLRKAARQYAISHNIIVTSPLVAGIRTFFDEDGNDQQGQKQHNKPYECHDSVEAPLEEEPDLVFIFLHVAWPPC